MFKAKESRLAYPTDRQINRLLKKETPRSPKTELRV